MAEYVITSGFEFSFLWPVLLKFIFEPKGTGKFIEWWMGVA